MEKLLRVSLVILFLSIINFAGFAQTKQESSEKTRSHFRDSEIRPGRHHYKHRGHNRYSYQKSKHGHRTHYRKGSWIGNYLHLGRSLCGAIFFWFSILHFGGTIFLFFILKSALQGKEVSLNFSIS